MSEKKKMLKFFSITQYEEEAEFLSQQHKNGWKLEKILFPGIYYFEKCQPEDVVYQLDYQPERIKNEKEYIGMFEDCGWEYLFDFVGYSYFRKPAEKMTGREEIFCDDESRLNMMRSVLRNKMLPLMIIFMCIIVPTLFHYVPRQGFISFIPITYTILFAIYVIAFIICGVGYYRFAKKIKK